MKSPLYRVITGYGFGSSKFEWVFHFSLMGFSSLLDTHDAVNNRFQMPEVPSCQQLADGCTDDGLHALRHSSILNWLVWVTSSYKLKLDPLSGICFIFSCLYSPLTCFPLYVFLQTSACIARPKVYTSPQWKCSSHFLNIFSSLHMCM